jgi:4-hydroxy-2-oxoglutarate aldolase
MNSPHKTLSGVFAPIVTPFNTDESIDFSALANNIQVYNTTPLRGYMPLGSNGEFLGLTNDESIAVLNTVVTNKSSDKIIVAGCGRESAYHTVEFIKQIAHCGLDMAFVLPPHYYVSQMTTAALMKYYETVADNSPVPIVIYNAPKFASGLHLTPELIKMLSTHSRIVALKNSSTQCDHDYIDSISADRNFSVIAGNIQTFYTGLLDGALGGVLSTASYLPDYCCKLYDLFIVGETLRAKELSDFLIDVSLGSIGKYGVPGVKVGMDFRGLHGGTLRLPLLPLSEDIRENIFDFLAENHIGKLS